MPGPFPFYGSSNYGEPDIPEGKQPVAPVAPRAPSVPGVSATIRPQSTGSSYPQITSASPAPSSGAFLPDQLYDVADPRKAFWNALWSSGVNYNPYSGVMDEMVSRWAPTAFAQYMGSLAQGGDPSGKLGGQGFGDFLKSFLSGGFGQGGTTPWDYGQATQGLGAINSVMQNVQGMLSSQFSPEQIAGMTPAQRSQALTQGGASPIHQAIAGLLGNPEMMMGLYGGAYSGAMGSGLSAGLNNILRQRLQQYNYRTRYLGGGLNSGQMPSLLDILTGSSSLPGA